MKVEQAIFTSAKTERFQGYHLVGRSRVSTINWLASSPNGAPAIEDWPTKISGEAASVFSDLRISGALLPGVFTVVPSIAAGVDCKSLRPCSQYQCSKWRVTDLTQSPFLRTALSSGYLRLPHELSASLPQLDFPDKPFGLGKRENQTSPPSPAPNDTTEKILASLTIRFATGGWRNPNTYRGNRSIVPPSEAGRKNKLFVCNGVAPSRTTKVSTPSF